MEFRKLKEDDNRCTCPECGEKGFPKGSVVVRIGYNAYGSQLTVRQLHFNCWYAKYGGYMPSTKVIAEAKRMKFMSEV